MQSSSAQTSPLQRILSRTFDEASRFINERASIRHETIARFQNLHRSVVHQREVEKKEREAAERRHAMKFRELRVLNRPQQAKRELTHHSQSRHHEWDETGAGGADDGGSSDELAPQLQGSSSALVSIPSLAAGGHGRPGNRKNRGKTSPSWVSPHLRRKQRLLRQRQAIEARIPQSGPFAPSATPLAATATPEAGGADGHVAAQEVIAMVSPAPGTHHQYNDQAGRNFARRPRTAVDKRVEVDNDIAALFRAAHDRRQRMQQRRPATSRLRRPTSPFATSKHMAPVSINHGHTRSGDGSPLARRPSSAFGNADTTQVPRSTDWLAARLEKDRAMAEAKARSQPRRPRNRAQSAAHRRPTGHGSTPGSKSMPALT